MKKEYWLKHKLFNLSAYVFPLRSVVYQVPTIMYIYFHCQFTMKIHLQLDNDNNNNNNTRIGKCVMHIIILYGQKHFGFI